MKAWRDVLFLVTFEWNHTKKWIGTYMLAIMLFALLLYSTLPSYIDRAFKEPDIIDFHFFITFTILIEFAKPTSFRLQKISHSTNASYYVVGLHQLPIHTETIAKSKMIARMIISLVIYGILLTWLYTGFHGIISISHYLVFAFIWICYSMVLGMMSVTFEAGTNIYKNIAISFFVVLILLLIYVSLFFEKGLVFWTMEMTSKYPIYSVSISLGLVIMNWFFWKQKMIRKLRTFDYMK